MRPNAPLPLIPPMLSIRQLGYCLERLNRHEDAIRAFRQAIAIDPARRGCLVAVCAKLGGDETLG